MGSMLIVNRLSPSAARYYADGPGRWLGGGAAALGLNGAVELAVLERVLAGRDPEGREPLPDRMVAHRRAGWDLILAAPKSVSLVAALRPPPSAQAVHDAHRAAVDQVVGWFEAQACWARRGGGLVASDGLVAAGFTHTRSASGDPHVHTHLVVANLTRADGRWSALDGSSLWVHRRAVGAAYDLALRHELGTRGIGGWRDHGDGTWDLAAVPAAAIAASSRRERDVHGAIGAGASTRSSRRAARVLTRSDPDGRWWAEVTAAGFGPMEAAMLGNGRAGRAGPGGAPDPPPPGPGRGAEEPSTAVTSWLVDRRSSFTTVDALSALAATQAGGAAPQLAQAWAESWCAAAGPAPGGRRTTPEAAAVDREVTERIAAGRSAGLAVAAPAGPARRELGPSGDDRVSGLLRSGDAVELLAGGRRREGLVDQAGVVEAAVAAWRSAGLEPAVLCPPTAASRWRALTGLEPPGSAPSPVLVVDRSDRLGPVQLADLLHCAGDAGTKLVLVQGGTLPPLRRAMCEGFASAAEAERSIEPPGVGPHRSGTHAALDATVAAWMEGRSAGAVMAGLGPGEVVELNRRAREALRSAGDLSGPEVVLGGRAFAAGDRVIPLGRAGGSPGSSGTVVSVGDRQLRVAWDRGPVGTLDHWGARHVGHAYALTPPGLALRPGPVVVLGRAQDLGRHAGRVEREIDLAAGPRIECPLPDLPGRSGPDRQPVRVRESPGLGL